MLSLEKFKRSVAALEWALQTLDEWQPKASEKHLNTLQSGVIQNFEVTYEMSWKILRRVLITLHGEREFDGISRRDLFRFAGKEGLLDDVEFWIFVHAQRNNTTHNYGEEFVRRSLELACHFLPKAQQLTTKLEQQNHAD